jgi:GT2 family glycosyltransferase
VLVSAIVVNLDGRELLLECLASLQVALAQVDGPTEIVVVDNGSTDDSVAHVRERFEAVRIVGLERNIGFAGGVNVGLVASSGEWLLLLNNDATIEPGAVSALLRAAHDRPGVGSLAAQMRFARTGALNSAGLGVDRLGVAFDRHIGEPPESAGSEVVEVFGASAGAALVRRTMLDEIGRFDDSFFMYLDDVDVAWRARMAGWTCLYVPGAVVHHHHSASSVHNSSFKHLHVGRNRVRLLAKHAPPAQLLRYGPAIVAHDLAYVVVAGLGDRTLAPLRGRLQGVRRWPQDRADGRATRRAVELAAVQGPRRALARRRSARRGTVLRAG